jgi:hypothetical protein
MGIGRRLKGTSAQSNNNHTSQDSEGEADTRKIVNAEIKKNPEDRFENVELSRDRPGITVQDVVQWQVENHSGFVRSFVSSLRYAPIEGQAVVWRELRKREGKVMVLVGERDEVIVEKELVSEIPRVDSGYYGWIMVSFRLISEG